MTTLPSTIIQHVYEHVHTYNIKVDKVIKQLSAHCFIYGCSECFKPYNRCFCYCVTCGTYLRFCRQIYFDQDSVYDKT